jgi:hypothetical protein
MTTNTLLSWAYFREKIEAAENPLSFLEKELGKGFFKSCGRN